MKGRFIWSNLLIVLIAIAGIVLYEYVYTPHKEESEKKASEFLLFPDFNPDLAERIEMVRLERMDKLVKKDKIWLVESEGDYPADPDSVKELLDTIKELKAGEIVTRNKDKYDVFDLSEGKGLEIKVSGSSNKVLAELYVGKRGPTYDSSYCRKEGADEVFLVYKNLITIFDRTNDTWKDKAIFRLKEEDIKLLNIVDGATVLSIERDKEKGGWVLIEETNRLKLKEYMVNNITSSFSKLTTDDFASSVTVESAGLSSPSRRIMVTLFDGKTYELLVGKKIKDEERFYVKRGDEPTIFIVSASKLDSLFRSRAELIETEKEGSESESILPPPPLKEDAPSGGKKK